MNDYLMLLKYMYIQLYTIGAPNAHKCIEISLHVYIINSYMFWLTVWLSSGIQTTKVK